jgi:H+-transporting ATPase
MTPLGWTYAGLVWGYALVMFIIQDRVKFFGYSVLGEKHSGWFGKRHQLAE